MSAFYLNIFNLNICWLNPFNDLLFCHFIIFFFLIRGEIQLMSILYC
ncbi:hypothetical protein DR64_1622 [Paraburkholderia xenovorans LB400]|nr:hypothetical protein DR64_1622 [Paraburkholderia xenovorans LB400]